MNEDNKINADINSAGDGWIQVTLSGGGANDLTESDIEHALSPQKPAAWYWEDNTGCFHITLDVPEVEAMAAIVGCKPEPLYPGKGNWSRFFDIGDSATQELASAYQKYLDAVSLYNERWAIMQTKKLGTMHVDEEYQAIGVARKAFDALAVEIAKKTIEALPNRGVTSFRPIDKQTRDQIASIMLQFGTQDQKAEAIDYVRNPTLPASNDDVPGLVPPDLEKHFRVDVDGNIWDRATGENVSEFLRKRRDAIVSRSGD